MKTDVHALHS
jgi:hypothetical protein